MGPDIGGKPICPTYQEPDHGRRIAGLQQVLLRTGLRAHEGISLGDPEQGPHFLRMPICLASGSLRIRKLACLLTQRGEVHFSNMPALLAGKIIITVSSHGISNSRKYAKVRKPYNPYITHYSSFHFVFHYPYRTVI